MALLNVIFLNSGCFDSSELKRRTKEREKAAKKAERESNAPSPAVAAGQAVSAVNEDQLDPTVRYFIAVMHTFGAADPYDHYSNITKIDPARFKSCVKR